MKKRYLTKAKGWYSFERGDLDIDMVYNKDIGKVRVIVENDEIISINILEINDGNVTSREIEVADFIEYINMVWDEDDDWTSALIVQKMNEIYEGKEDKWLEVFEVKDADQICSGNNK